MKRELWEVWKDEVSGQWLVQFPKGRMDYRTKKQAQHVADTLKAMDKADRGEK